MQNIPKNKKTFPREYGARQEGAVRAADRTRMICIKRIAAFTVCLIFILSNCITVFADDVQSNNRTVKAGIFSFDGYHMKDGDRLTGYGIVFLNLVSK